MYYSSQTLNEWFDSKIKLPNKKLENANRFNKNLLNTT